MERTDERVQQFREWYFGPQDGACPGCGERWEKDRTGRVDSILIHNPRCDYIVWVDEEDAKNQGVYEVGITGTEDDPSITARRIQ